MLYIFHTFIRRSPHCIYFTSYIYIYVYNQAYTRYGICRCLPLWWFAKQFPAVLIVNLCLSESHDHNLNSLKEDTLDSCGRAQNNLHTVRSARFLECYNVTGTYSAQMGLGYESECTPCTAGSYCAQTGLTAVEADCAQGYYCPSGSEVCTHSLVRRACACAGRGEGGRGLVRYHTTIIILIGAIAVQG